MSQSRKLRSPHQDDFFFFFRYTMQRNTSQNATLKQKAEKQSFKDKHQNIEGSFLALPQG